MTFTKRKPPGVPTERPSEYVLAGNFDTFRNTPNSPELQARRRNFARAMVFEAFKYKHARALDQGTFIDRRPDQASRFWRST